MNQKCFISALGLLIVFSLLADLAYSDPVLSNRVFVAKPVWSIAQKHNNMYVLEPWFLQRGDLIGAMIDDNGDVYLCDKISEQLVKLDANGKRVFSVGAVGEGPEDHRTHGEPLPWVGGNIARSDASLTPKVIVYGTDGSFLHRVQLETGGELTRLFWNGKSAVALVGKAKPNNSGNYEISIYLQLLNADGTLVRQHLMNRTELSRVRERPEEEVWDRPYVSVSNDGFSFVQQDLYGGRVDCYDSDLNLAWSINGGWRPTARTAEELAAVEAQGITGLIYSRVNHTIKRMFAREDGEVWIQPWIQTRPDGIVELESFGREGTHLGSVRISGLPSSDGSWIMRGSKILWMDNAENISDEAPKIRVFDLIPQ